MNSSRHSNSQRITVYRSPREEGLYLYLRHGDGLDTLPEALLKQFGKAEVALTLELGPERKLARANAADVLNNIAEKGYYLQLPPAKVLTP